MASSPHSPDASTARKPVGRLLGLKDVVRETSLSKTTIYRRIPAGTFPAARSIGENRVAWRESDIESWKADPAGWSSQG